MLLSKEAIHQTCIDLVVEKIATLEQAIQDANEAANEDTKSSAGDKFETSREMMSLEINKNTAQLGLATEMLRHLRQIDPEATRNKVAFGSLVATNEGLYFFSVSLGKIKVEDKVCFALSLASPIGQALADKKAGDKVSFMNREVEILGIE